MIRKRALYALPAIAGCLIASNANAELSAEELAKIAQNPVANLISVPFQNNTNLNYGPEKKTQNILNIQPVIPVSINSEWNVITRTIVPVVSQPALTSTEDRSNGTGDTVFTAFLSPAKPGAWIWGAGPVVQAPTSSNGLGNHNWGMGPSAVFLRLDKSSPWVYGALFNNIWSLSDNASAGGSYNNLTLQPFLNYNFAGGTYLTTSPIITANWKADNSQRWTVPVGGAVGKIFHLGRLPVNTQIGAYYNAIKPDYGPNWQVRFQVQFMFPK